MKKQLGPSWSQPHHWSPPALFALAVIIAASCISVCNAAPVHESTELEQYSGTCYYNYNHYNEGDRILTNEPCLNCTCHNQMLMCYLRVCPFTKPIGHDCVVEKREDQCCPIITCPDVPVELVDHKTDNKNEVGFAEKYGCYIDSKFYPEGAQVPSNPNKPCELCYCIRNRTSCLMQECTLHVDGCQPIYNRGVCCPVRYDCEHDSAMTGGPYLEDSHTTVRPTEGFILTTSPSIKESTSCVYNDVTIADGALIPDTKPCEHCYCMKGDIVCAVQECAIDIEHTDGKNCTYLPPPAGVCCPESYICQDDETIHKIADEKHDTGDAASTTLSLPVGHEEETATESSDDLHNKLPETISEEDVQLQEHIDDIPLTSTAKPVEADGATTVPAGGNIKFAHENELGGVESTTVMAEEGQEAHKPESESSSEHVIESSDSSHTPSESTVTELPVKSETGAEQELTPTTDSSESSASTPSEILPIVIPGEGDCLLNSVTYYNNSDVPSVSKCDVHCICVSSIIKCKKVECMVALGGNCRLAESQDPEACCPEYVCDGEESPKPYGSEEELLPTASPADLEHEQATTIAGEMEVEKKPEDELTPDHESKPEQGQTEQTLAGTPAAEEPLEHEAGSGAGEMDTAHVPHSTESDIADPERVEDRVQTEVPLVDEEHTPESQTEEGAHKEEKPIIDIQPTHTPEDVTPAEHEQTSEHLPGATESEMEPHPEAPFEEVKPDTEHTVPPLIHHPEIQETSVSPAEHAATTEEVIAEQDMDAEHGTEAEPEVAGQTDLDRKHIMPEEITTSPESIESMSHVTSEAPLEGEQMAEEHVTEVKEPEQEMQTETPLAAEKEHEKPEIEQPEQPEPEKEMTTDELMSAVLEILKGTDAPTEEQEGGDELMTTDKVMVELPEEHVAPEHGAEEHVSEHGMEHSTEQGLEDGLEEATEHGMEQAPEHGLEQTSEHGLEHSTEQGLEEVPAEHTSEHAMAELPEAPVDAETPKPATSEEAMEQQPLPTQQPAEEPSPAVGGEEGLQQEPSHETSAPVEGETASPDVAGMAHTTEMAADKIDSELQQPEEPHTPEHPAVDSMITEHSVDKTTALPESTSATPVSSEQPIKHTELVGTIEPEAKPEETVTPSEEESAHKPELPSSELPAAVDEHKEMEPSPVETTDSSLVEGEADKTETATELEHHVDEKLPEEEMATSAPVELGESVTKTPGLPEKAEEEEDVQGVEEHMTESHEPHDIATEVPVGTDERISIDDQHTGTEEHAVSEEKPTTVQPIVVEHPAVDEKPEEPLVPEVESHTAGTEEEHIPAEHLPTEAQPVAEEKPLVDELPAGEEMAKPELTAEDEKREHPATEEVVIAVTPEGEQMPSEHVTEDKLPEAHVPDEEHMPEAETPAPESQILEEHPMIPEGQTPEPEQTHEMAGEEHTSTPELHGLIPEEQATPEPEQTHEMAGEEHTSTPELHSLIPEEHATEEDKPEKHIPEEHVTEAHIPAEHLPEEHKPEEHVPAGHLPEDHKSEEHVPTEHLPEEHKPEEHVPTEHLPEEHIPTEHLPEEHIPTEIVPEEHRPEEHVPEEQLSAEHLPEEHKPEEHIPTELMPEEHVPEEHTSTEHLPEELVPVEQMPEEQKPEEGLPTEHLPEEHIPTEHMPEEHIPTEHMPEEHISPEHIPTEHIPTEHLPEEHKPEEHIPTEHLPEEHIPTEHVPEEHIPTEHVPEEHAPEQPMSGEEMPQEHLPAEHIPEVESTSTHLAPEVSEVPTTVASIPEDTKHEMPSEEHTVESHTEGEHVAESHTEGEHVPESHTEAEHLPESQTEAGQLPADEHLPEEEHPKPEDHVAETATEQALPAADLVTVAVSEEITPSSTVAAVAEDALKGEVSESTTAAAVEEISKPEEQDLTAGAVDTSAADSETSSGDSTTAQPALAEATSTEKAEVEEIHTTVATPAAPASGEVKDDKEHMEPVHEDHKTESSLPVEGSFSTTEAYEHANKTEETAAPVHPHHPESVTEAPQTATEAAGHPDKPHHPHYPHHPQHPASSEESTGLHPTPTGADNESDTDFGPLPGGQYPSFGGDEDYNEEEDPSAFGPGTCRYGGKLFVSAQQIPRDDPCDFCFCFRSDIICLQQSCPPPISGCHEEPISGFCCPRYECPVLMGGVLNMTTTTTTTTTMPPLAHHRPSELIKRTGCYIGGQSYKVGDAIESASGPCISCSCGGDGQMKCEPKVCTPEPMLRQMIAVVASRRRR